MKGESAGTKAPLRRLSDMKKIAIISASVLALGAASIAADAGSISLRPATASFASEASAALVSAHSATFRGARLSGQVIERKIRLVSSGIAPVESCEVAYWPYYPSECLKRVDIAGL
jgi:hypothetical protein